MGQTFNNIDGAFYWATGATAASLLEEVREWTIDTSTNSSDDGAQGDSWETSTIGRSTFDLSVTTNYNLATGGGQLQKDVIAKTAGKFYAYPSRYVPTVYWYGTGTMGGGGKGGGMEDTGTQSYTLIPSGQPGYVHP